MNRRGAPRTVTATRLIRKTRGGSQAHLLEADDGSCYVTKFLQNPQGRRTVINELLSAYILEHLGIATPESVFVNVTEDFLAANRSCGIERRTLINPGRHFGSACPVDPRREPIYDFVPNPLLRQVHNICEVLGALVFDRWVANTDGRQMVFFRARASRSAYQLGYLCRIIDNGYAFNGNDWSFYQGMRSGLYPRAAVYGSVRSLDDFQPWLDLAMDLPQDLLVRAVHQLPGEWLLPGENRELEQLMCRLIQRQKHLPESLVYLCESEPSLFPAWQRKTTLLIS